MRCDRAGAAVITIRPKGTDANQFVSTPWLRMDEFPFGNLTMTFPFPIHQADPPAPPPAGPTNAPSDPAGPEASRLTGPPQIGSRPAAVTPDAKADAAPDPRIPVAVSRPDAADAGDRIEPATGESRPFGVLWRAAALGMAACLGAVAGSAGSAAVHVFGPAPRTSQADPLDDLRSLKESVAQLRGHVKVVNDNLAGLRANFGTVTSALTSQLAKISDEVEKVERLQSDRRAGTSGAESAAAPAPSEAKPPRPPVVEGWVLRSVSDGVALVEGRHGVIEIEPGDSLPGIGRIHEIKRQDGHWVVVTPKGLIVSAR